MMIEMKIGDDLWQRMENGNDTTDVDKWSKIRKNQLEPQENAEQGGGNQH